MNTHALNFVCSRLLLGEVGIDQSGQPLDCRVLVSAVSDNTDRCALDNAEGQNTQKALGIHAPLFFLDPDAALEFIGDLDEKCGGSGVKTDLVIDDYLFGYHA